MVQTYDKSLKEAQAHFKRRRVGEVFACRAKISPAAAQVLYDDKNFVDNRRFDEVHAEAIAYAMMEGHVGATETITVVLWDGKEYLVDGQHRMWAVTQLSEPWEFTINFKRVKTWEDVCSAYGDEDLGKKRSTEVCAKALSVDDQVGTSKKLFKNALSASKLINVGFDDGSKAKLKISRNNHHTIETVLNYRKEWKKVDAAYKKGDPNTKKLFFNQATVAVAGLTYRHCPDKAEEFWGVMLADDGLKKGDPRKALLDFLRDLAMNKVLIKPSKKALYISMAWNAFYAGRKMTRLKWRDDLVVASGLVLAGTPWDGSKHAP